MADKSNAPFKDVPIEPHAKIKQLIERLTGRWRVKGPGIDGEAEYWPVKGDQSSSPMSISSTRARR